MSDEIENIDQITKFLSGEMNAQEEEDFRHWRNASSENEHQFDVFKKLWSGVEDVAITKDIDLDEEWRSFESTIALDENKVDFEHTVKQKNSWMKVAAAIVIIVAGAYFLNSYFQSNTYEEFAALEESINQDLPDGSSVTLNKNSSLRFAKSEFGKSNRNVNLKGECFFDVERDEEKPFSIFVNDYVVKVLGTSFFVDGKSNDSLIVMVQTGKVAVYLKEKPDEVTYLKAGDKGVFKEAEQFIHKSSKDDKNEFAWQTKKLSFKKKKLSKVVRKLNNLYNSQIIIGDKALENCRLTATFDKQPLDQVLKVLEETIGLKAIKEGDEIVLKGEGC